MPSVGIEEKFTARLLLCRHSLWFWNLLFSTNGLLPPFPCVKLGCDDICLQGNRAIYLVMILHLASRQGKIQTIHCSYFLKKISKISKLQALLVSPPIFSDNLVFFFLCPDVFASLSIFLISSSLLIWASEQQVTKTSLKSCLYHFFR